MFYRGIALLKYLLTFFQKNVESLLKESKLVQMTISQFFYSLYYKHLVAKISFNIFPKNVNLLEKIVQMNQIIISQIFIFVRSFIEALYCQKNV